MRINKWGLGILTVVVIGAGVTFWQFQKGRANQVNYKTIHAQTGTIETFISTTGDVLPKNRLEIKPPVNGRVESILVQEGDLVKTGQIVAWMSSTDRAALLDAARGKSDESLKYWQDVYKPIALVAPIDGQVIVATMQPGQTVTTSDAVIVLSDRLIFRAQVDETDIGKIKLGQEASVTMDAYPGVKVNAKVDHIYYESQTVNNVTLYLVDLTPDNLPSFCRSGMNVNVEFRDQFKENILTLPVTAVQKGKNGSFVMVKDEETGKPSRRPVKLGISDDTVVEVVSGLTAEDRVLVKNQKVVLSKGASGTNPFAPQRPRGR
jgi:membrane fusion protein, macrolide-specific efflux system